MLASEIDMMTRSNRFHPLRKKVHVECDKKLIARSNVKSRVKTMSKV